MQVVLLSEEKLIEDAVALDPDMVMTIIDSTAPWHRDDALALLLQESFGRAPVN
jgi:hypothetical protein